MSKEILMVVDAVSNEKGVEKDIIFEAIEAALASATRRKHGEDIDVRVAIDRDSGEYDTFRRWLVFEDESTELEFPDRELRMIDAVDINENAEPGGYVDVDRIDHAQFAIRKLELSGLVLEDQPTTKRVVLAAIPIDSHANVDVFAVLSPRRGRQRRLDCLEYDVFLNALFVRNGVNNHQDLFAHYLKLQKSRPDYAPSGTSRAVSIVASSSVCDSPSTSTKILSSSTDTSLPRNRLRPSIGKRVLTFTISPVNL